MTELKIEQQHLINTILSAYHTTRLNGDPATHILSKPSVQDAFARFEQSLRPTAPDAVREAIKAVRQQGFDEAIEMAAKLAEDFWTDDCETIATAIRALGDE